MQQNGTAQSQMSLTHEAQARPGPFVSGSRWAHWVEQALALIFPPRCAGCDRVDTHWCPDCQARLDAVALEVDAHPCPPLRAIAVTAQHAGLPQQMLWALKYQNGWRLAEPLGQRLNTRFAGLGWPVDLVVPVPIHAVRVGSRGYNQAQLLAEAFAHSTGLALRADALQRLHQTQSQVGLDRQARLQNMQGAFVADSQLVMHRHLLIVDDVFTTGATIAACAQAALDAGATAVYGLTVTAA